MKRTRLYRQLAIPMVLAVVSLIGVHPPAPDAMPGTLVPGRPHRTRDTRSHGESFRKISALPDAMDRELAWTTLARSWMAEDPKGALDFIRSLPPGEMREALYRHLLAAWAGLDPDKAMAWADGMEDPAERSNVRAILCATVAEGSPREAIELALGHSSEGAGCEGLLESLAMQWAERESAEALEWVRQQPAGEWHDRLMARVAFILSKSDPMSAAHHVTEEMTAGPRQDEAILSVVHQWMKADPGAALEWVETFPEGALRMRALGEMEACAKVAAVR